MNITTGLLIRSLPNCARSLINLRNFSNRDKKAQELLEEIYKEIIAQRFKDVVVIEPKNNADPRYIILATAFSPRHLLNGTQLVNKNYKNLIKSEEQDFAKLSISPEWNVLDFDSVVLHLFSKKCRDHYDIEQLWAVGEEYDNLVQKSA